MIRHVLTFCALVFAASACAQQHCAAMLGGCYFINCKSLVSYQGQDVVRFNNWSDPLGSVDLDVYSTEHRLEAQVRGGKLVKGAPERFKVKRTDTEFSLIDSSTGRIICILKKVPSTTDKATCQVNVWLDLYVSGAGYFHCDPEKSNEPTMQYMSGVTFSDSQNGIALR